MTVWIVNPFDNLPLEGNRPQRYWLLARAFARAGHDVTLWTSDFSHARKAKRACVCGAARPLGRRGAVVPCGETPGFRVVLVETPPYRRNIGLARVWSHRAFARRWRALAAGGPPPDVLVTSLPPLALGAAAARVRGARTLWVVDVMDAWPETFARVAPRLLLAPLRRTAGRIYRGADALVGVAERYVALARAYGATCPMRVVHHGIDAAAPAAAPARTDGAFRLVYAGNMGASYDLATLVAAARALPGVTLDLAGGGPREAALRAQAAGCARIRFHGYLGADALRALLAACDTGVVPMFDASCVGVPYKLADYAAAGLPVLNSLSGETARLLAAYGAGATYAAGDAAALAAAAAAWRDARATPAWARLRDGARRLAAAFDARALYGGYVAWVERLRAERV